MKPCEISICWNDGKQARSSGGSHCFENVRSVVDSQRVCSVCERTLSENPATACSYCNFTYNLNANSSASKRLFRVLMFIATDTKVFVVIIFDRAARVIFGCSADEFFDFAKTNPYAADAACRVLEGEMLTVTLSKPNNEWIGSNYRSHFATTSHWMLTTCWLRCNTKMRKRSTE